MRLEEGKPSDELKKYINRYLDIEATATEMPEVKIYPTGYLYLTHIYDKSAIFYSSDLKEKLPKLFVGGQVTKQQITLLPQNKFCHFGIEFHPTAFYKLFGKSPLGSLNYYLNFESLVSRKDILIFKNATDPNLSFTQKCQNLNLFFESKLNMLEDATMVDQAIELIQGAKGEMSIQELAKKVFLSERQFRRNAHYLLELLNL